MSLIPLFPLGKSYFYIIARSSASGKYFCIWGSKLEAAETPIV